MTWVNHAQSLIAYNQWANAKTRAPVPLVSNRSGTWPQI
jgi:hypothetical protein